MFSTVGIIACIAFTLTKFFGIYYKDDAAKQEAEDYINGKPKKDK